MLEMGAEILPVLKRTPLLAGVCATDPFRRMDKLLETVKALGFAGTQNFPTVGLMDGVFRQNLEETGMSYSLEVGPECPRTPPSPPNGLACLTAAA